MHWFGGSIAEAVNLSKQRNAIFVVFVAGDDDLSTQMASVIDHSAVVKVLSNPSNFLAIKLKSGSENYTHFAQIYQFVPVPSLFFIGRNGTPLEVVCAGVEAENLTGRIDRILEEHRQPPIATLPSTSSQSIMRETANLLQSEAAASPANTQPAQDSVPAANASEEPQAKPAASPQMDPTPLQGKATPPREKPESEPAAKVPKTDNDANEYEVVCDGDVCVRRPKARDGAGPSQGPSASATAAESIAQESTISVEEKLERAKVLIEARRREKEEKEKEAERQREIELRNQGQGVAELKRWQAEQEMKLIQEERKKEKMENNLARQRILEQIAQDRAERRARDAPAAPPSPPSPTTPTAATAPEQVAVAGDGSARARVQFKMPDGSSHSAQFDADGTLAEVHRYVSDNLQMSPSSFSLWTAFPRRELTESDQTLRMLHLAPSAALLVLPRRQPAPVANPGALASVITIFTQLFASYVLHPSQQLLDWLKARLWAGTPSRPPSDPTDPPAPRARTPPALRRRGNVHRLPGDHPADDDNNTWNGNSTQQM